MSKLIDFLNVYDNRVCTDVGKLLVFIKNIFASCKKQRLFNYYQGYVFAIRWSNEKNKIVIDMGTSLERDISGIDLQNINKHYRKDHYLYNIFTRLLSSIDSKNLNDYYNIKKNPSKFIAITYSENTSTFYTLGLYSFTKTKKRIGVYHKKNKSILIDNTVKFKNDINSLFDILKPVMPVYINDHRKIYNMFISQLKSKTYLFNSTNRNHAFNFNTIIKDNIKFDYKISCKRVKEIITTENITEDEVSIYKSNIARQMIALEMYNFLFENNIVNNFVYYYDDKTDTNYKIKNLETLNFNDNNINLTTNKLCDPYLLLPLKV
jgi:hypothetical protein